MGQSPLRFGITGPGMIANFRAGSIQAMTAPGHNRKSNSNLGNVRSWEYSGIRWLKRWKDS